MIVCPVAEADGLICDSAGATVIRDSGGETAKPAGWLTVKLDCAVWADAGGAADKKHPSAAIRTNNFVRLIQSPPEQLQ